jgi:hypothetical protein
MDGSRRIEHDINYGDGGSGNVLEIMKVVQWVFSSQGEVIGADSVSPRQTQPGKEGPHCRSVGKYERS